MNKDELMKQIQETGFALYDLTLFLDSHPKDQMALDFFTDVQKQYTQLQAEYEMMYLSLIHIFSSLLSSLPPESSS